MMELFRHPLEVVSSMDGGHAIAAAIIFHALFRGILQALVNK